MRIVSLNAWGGAMYEPLTNWLPISGADVLCLQEDSGPVFDEIGTRYQQNFGIALFASDQYPIVCSKTEFVHGSYIDYAEWPIVDRPRIAHVARVVDRASDRTVSIAHMHGLREPAGKDDSPARHAQAEGFAESTCQLHAGVRTTGDHSFHRTTVTRSL